MSQVANDQMPPAQRQQPLANGRFLLAIFGLLLLLFLPACTQPTSPLGSQDPITIELAVDGQRLNLTTTANTVRELLDEAGITLNQLDEVSPPLFTPLTTEMSITVVRVEERIEVTSEAIPFERKVVRSSAMEPDDPPRIVQPGKDGLQDVTVRIVIRDGEEAERWVTQTTIIEPPTDEIVMIGIGAAQSSNVSFAGVLAFINGGNAVVMRGNTAFPETLAIDGTLDGRVFTLSPDGNFLLYTQTAVSENSTGFSNTLWVINTQRGAQPRPLGVENVLWAGWNPARTDLRQIAYTTANTTNLPPGWEANNDLWLGNVLESDTAPFEPEQIIESYPATYGWWGGQYAWSPDGSRIAYAYANEIGVIDLTGESPFRTVLHTFTEYDTLQDWVWVPSLSWSANGRFLAFSQHSANDPQADAFDTVVIDTFTGVNGRFMANSGMWAHPYWNTQPNSDTPLLFLRALNPLDTLRSSYALWQIDSDGSNSKQLYPPPGENSFFPRQQQFMAWGPTGRDIAFIFNDALVLFNLDTQEARRITTDDATASHPTWAPYGTAVPANLPQTTVEEVPTAVPSLLDGLLPDEQ